ncbi:MAG: hypothetical protein AAFR56_16555, partial [Chloroflexota bacterium]
TGGDYPRLWRGEVINAVDLIRGNFKQMMEAEAYEEELVIFVGKDFLRPIRRFITIIVDTFSVSQASKFHFVDTFEQALELVQQTRSTPAD